MADIVQFLMELSRHSLNFVMFSDKLEKVKAHRRRVSEQSDFSTVSAIVSKAYGTAITAKAGIRELMSRSVFQGIVAVPPIIANVSIIAPGARAVQKVDCTTLEPFLRE